MDQRIQIAREIAISYEGLFYKWGGDDPSGFDCSGFIIEILKSVGAFPRSGDMTADGLYKRYTPCVGDELGNLVYWGTATNPRARHVEFCIGHGLAIGASGGGSKTLTHADAIKQNAYIKIRPYGSRIGIIGFNDPFIGWRD